MSNIWVRFTATGNSNGESLPEWPTYTEERGLTLFFDNPCEVVADYDRTLMEFFNID